MQNKKVKATLKIQNLKCHGCANTIFSKLSGLGNMTDVEVNNNDDTVSFSYKSDTELHDVENLLLKLGYPVIGDNNMIATIVKYELCHW